MGYTDRLFYLVRIGREDVTISACDAPDTLRHFHKLPWVLQYPGERFFIFSCGGSSQSFILRTSTRGMPRMRQCSRRSPSMVTGG